MSATATAPGPAAPAAATPPSPAPAPSRRSFWGHLRSANPVNVLFGFVAVLLVVALLLTIAHYGSVADATRQSMAVDSRIDKVAKAASDAAQAAKSAAEAAKKADSRITALEAGVKADIKDLGQGVKTALEQTVALKADVDSFKASQTSSSGGLSKEITDLKSGIAALTAKLEKPVAEPQPPAAEPPPPQQQAPVPPPPSPRTSSSADQDDELAAVESQWYTTPIKKGDWTRKFSRKEIDTMGIRWDHHDGIMVQIVRPWGHGDTIIMAPTDGTLRIPVGGGGYSYIRFRLIDKASETMDDGTPPKVYHHSKP